MVEDTFDALNRNTSRTVTLATGFLGTTDETRVYDALDRMTRNQDNDYQLDYEYAVIGLRSYIYEENQQYVGGTAYAKQVTKTYDAKGNKVSEAYPSGANLSLVYTYNSVDNLATITDGTNTIMSYSYVGLREKGATYQSNATRSISFTGFRNEIATVHHQTNAPTTILQLDYAYNKVHDRIYEQFGGASGDAFEYDKIRRLKRAWMGSSNPGSPGPPATYTKKIDYNMDDDGNRTSVVVTLWGQSPGTTSYTTNNLNEYTAVGGTTHVWDANGNLTDNGTFKFEYNYKNLIVKVRKKSDNSVVATYKYDTAGRRVEKEVGETTERYIRSTTAAGPHDQRDNPGGGERYDMSQVVAVYDGSNSWLQSFVWGQQLDSIEMLEQKDVLDFDSDSNVTEVTRSFYHRNALGSVMEITDLNQAGVVSYRYDPYGKVTITRGGTPQTSDPLGQHWTFTARFFDEESELYYYRARYYDPGVGRFLQRDPLGYKKDQNLFQYVGSRPVSLFDPTGLKESDEKKKEDLEVWDFWDEYKYGTPHGGWNSPDVNPYNPFSWWKVFLPDIYVPRAPHPRPRDPGPGSGPKAVEDHAREAEETRRRRKKERGGKRKEERGRRNCSGELKKSSRDGALDRGSADTAPCGSGRN